MEGDAVDDGHEEEGPVGAAFGDRNVAGIVYREEDVGGLGEVGEGFFEGEGIGCLHEHKCH